MKTTNLFYVVLVVFIISFDFECLISGYPKKGKQTTSVTHHRTSREREQSEHNSFLNLLSINSFSQAEDTKSSANDGLLAKCKHIDGDQRTKCVVAYIRDLYPDSFGLRKDVENSTYDNKRRISTTKIPYGTNNRTLVTEPVETSTSSEIISPLLTTMTTTETLKRKCKSSFENRKKQTTKMDEILITSAFLIVPGNPKIIMPIIQDSDAYLPSSLGDDRIKPVTCRRDEFGFTEDIDQRIVDIASDMLCKLCQHQHDSMCIIRWCFHT